MDDLFIWMRKQKQNSDKAERQRARIGGRARTRDKVASKNKVEPFKIVNRPFDYKHLPPCRAKIVWMGHPKFMKRKKLIFGVQLYPPYFGQSSNVLKKKFSKQVLSLTLSLSILVWHVVCCVCCGMYKT